MRLILALITLLMCLNAHAVFIPPTLGGDPDTDLHYVSFTDTDGTDDDSPLKLTFRSGQFNTGDHEFGIYFANLFGDVTGMLRVFDSTASVGDDSNILIDVGTNIVTTVAGSFDLDATDSLLLFGFYAVSDGVTYYSNPDRNTDGNDHFGLYAVSDPFVSADVRVFFSDGGDVLGCGASCLDIFKVDGHDLTPTDPRFAPAPEPPPVSEPATLGLLGMILIGMAYGRARRTKILTKSVRSRRASASVA